MKNTLLAATLVLGMTAPAFAEDPVKADRSGIYVGGFIGSSTEDKSRLTLGADVGYQVGSYFRAELDIDRAWRTNSKDGYRVTVNGIGQYRIPNTVLTPYVIAGAGYAMDGIASIKNTNSQVAVWNAGAGVRVGLSQNTELDLRYREVRPFEAAKVSLKQDHVFTAGLNYRF